jgi:hypothetical protein
MLGLNFSTNLRVGMQAGMLRICHAPLKFYIHSIALNAGL